VVVLGLSRQLVGERAFGARGFRYCGSILAGAGDAQFEADAELLERAAALAQVAAEEFGLVGVNGIDFVAHAGVPYPVEVNPRYSASMELVERAYRLSVFGMHARACVGELLGFDVAAARRGKGAVGKAIVYARRTVTMGETRVWLRNRSVRDVPHPGERIPRGRPICTVFARGRDARSCHAALVRRAQRVYHEVERHSERRKIA
jgi:predicted ATP-grasp superfamily ATP-dependent carboligase